nr:hypothetical protein [Luteitalea pratensis]
MFEPVERGIERALLDPQQVIGNLLDALRDCPAMQGFEGDRSHDQQVESALQDVRLVAHSAPRITAR